MGHPMFTYDPGMSETIFEYCRTRLSLDPVPLDYGGIRNDPASQIEGLINEHGNDRKEITVTPDSDDPREKPVMTAQSYHFKVERADGKTVKWWVDGNEMLSWTDTAPLSGPGHDHFGFNDWDVKVCFDNVKVVPLPAP